jgi:hypothetical protein
LPPIGESTAPVRIAAPFRRRAVIAVGLVVLVVCVAVAALIGYLAAPVDESFGWEVAVLTGTGVATLALAVFTGILAVSTWQLAQATSRDVTATQRLADIAAQDQKRAVEPYLVVTSVDVSAYGPTDDVWNINLTISNVGQGPALEVAVLAFHQPREGGVADETFLYSVPAIGPGDAHHREGVDVSKMPNPKELPMIGGTYVDRDGNPPERITYGYQSVRPKYRPAQPPPPDSAPPPPAGDQ